MTVEIVLWLFAGLFVVIGALIGIIWKSVKDRLDDIDTGALAAFIARFNATESSWERWRQEFSGEVSKRLDSHSDQIRTNDRRITRLERNGHDAQGNRS